MIERCVVARGLGALALALAFSALAVPVEAANPQLNGLAPPGGRRGGDVDIVIRGARLGDAKELMLYYPGITVKELSAKSDGEVLAKLAIAPDCRLGSHAFRLRTASGMSNLILFSVGVLPEVQEVEPNNDFAKPQEMALDTTVNGIVTSEDVEYFAVQAKKGERITAEVEGIRLGRAFFDPYVAILNTDRFELASSDDRAVSWCDGVASVVAPEDGKYIIQLRETAYRGSGDSLYRLHVGRFPRPTAMLPMAGRFGETIEVKWLGDLRGEWTQKITLPKSREPYSAIYAPDNESTAVVPSVDGMFAPTPMLMRLGTLENTLEVEPNPDVKTATEFTFPRALNGVIGEPGDVDGFKFPLKKGQVVDIRVLARTLRSPLDSVLAVLASNGRGVASNDDAGAYLPDSYVRFTAPADDTYTITVTDMLRGGGPDYAYCVEVKPVEPTLTLGIPERIQYVDHVLTLPQGNRAALLISASRQNFGGDLKLDLQGLPAGVKVETIPMAANQSMVPVLFTAAADAPLAGALVDVVGRPTDEKLAVEGHVRQTSQLVRGQNNRPVFTHTTERLAAAVTEKAPFEIEVVPPKVPLVRSGSMDLKVVAKRAADFKAPIAVRLLYNPSGISSSGSISIAEGQTEAEIPLTAASNAELRTWKIVVVAEAAVGNGPVLTSSQLIDLQVAEPYFDFAFKASAVEQNKEVEIVIDATNNTEFDGEATVELLGLPAEAVAEPVRITKDATQVVFKVKTTGKTPAGRHKAIMARLVVTSQGEPITHTLGPGELRVDVPLPPKPVAAAKPAAPAPPPKPAVATTKPLSRLEQLRKEKADAAGAAPANQNQ